MPHRLGPFEGDLARAHTLPAFAYVDPAILAAEQARIFRRTWQPVAAKDDVREAGSFTTGEIGGAPIVVVRGADGVLRGFYNVCRHRAGPVATGTGKRKLLACRYHGWSYGLDGALVSAPELGDVKDFDRSCFGLRPIAVATWGPLVFACLAEPTNDDAVPSLAEVMGKIPEETAAYELEAMKLAARTTYDVACNWKVYVDNFLEGYHLPTVHPGLFRELDYDAYRVETFRFYSKQLAPIRPANPEAAKARHYEASAEADLAALYYWVFPGWMLNIYPDNMSLNVVVPDGPDRCKVLFEWYRRPGPDGVVRDDEVERTKAFSHGIQLEDMDICETVQRNLASGGYERGRFSVLRENGVHHFQSLVHEALTRAW